MIAFLIVVVIIVGVGATVLAYRNRPENSIESGISSFRREMRALAPPGQRRGGPGAGDDTPRDEDPSPDDRSGEPRSDGPRHDGPVPGAG